MLEVAAAISAAGSAYNAIKNAVERGREVSDLMGAFSQFFDAKDKLSEESAKASNPSMVGQLFTGRSVEAAALEATAAKHKIANMERELREFLIYSGQIGFYEDMMKERRNIRQAPILAAKRRAESKAFWIDVIACIVAVPVFFACIYSVFWMFTVNS